MTRKPAERVALVTGAGHGIGREIALHLAAEGLFVVATDVDGQRAEAVADELGHSGISAQLDVRKRERIDQIVNDVVMEFGQIDVLINNAGIYPNTPFLDLQEGEWDAVFDVNVKGMFLVSQAVARTMVDKRINGRIVNISSGASISGRPGAAHYATSKAASNMLTKVMAMELGREGITVNAIAPGLIEVPGWDHNPEYIDTLVKGIPIGRIGTPSDIARVVSFLIRPDSDFINGSIYFVDGGSSTGRTTVPFSRKP
jgi:NAD(P)-dependent dehydrogenase (short-subunit alcohol dehydrogenase family)